MNNIHLSGIYQAITEQRALDSGTSGKVQNKKNSRHYCNETHGNPVFRRILVDREYERVVEEGPVFTLVEENKRGY